MKLKDKKIITFSGAKGSGKDTLAGATKLALERENFPVRLFAFADTLYEELSQAFSVDPSFLRARNSKQVTQASLALACCQNNEFRRYALTRISEIKKEPVRLNTPLTSTLLAQSWSDFRKFTPNGDPDYFVDAVFAKIESTSPETVCLITDLRHDVEIAMLKKNYSPFLVRINATSQNNNDEDFIQKGHPSDWEWRKFSFDKVFLNVSGDMKGLEDFSSVLASSCLSRPPSVSVQ